MKKFYIVIEGMDCANCAFSVKKYFNQQGLNNVKINTITGDVSFDAQPNFEVHSLAAGIQNLGYQLQPDQAIVTKKNMFNPLKKISGKLIFTLVFTLPLFIGHILHIHWLMSPWVQLLLATPVYLIGMQFFAPSAFKSLRAAAPNMNVLVVMGATAAFGYSLYGFYTNNSSQYMFFETTATIICFMLLGSYLEARSMRLTQKALDNLLTFTKVKANLIGFDKAYQEEIMQIDSTALKLGDLVLIKQGELVPMDAKILWGTALVNESILTGESKPLNKQQGDMVIGGSMVEEGILKAQVTAVGEQTVLSKIIRLIKEAQTEKPPVQLLADRISRVFVPLIVGIAILMLGVNCLILKVGFTESLLRSIAILVIACPCAMGLATPAAIAVGLGRAARQGILFKNVSSLELFKDIKTVVFDKTGTLTEGKFSIRSFESLTLPENEFKNLVATIEKYANHPIGKSIAKVWKIEQPILWNAVEEIKGLGIEARDKEGNTYFIGSAKIDPTRFEPLSNRLYVLKNDLLIGKIELADALRPEAKAVIDALKKMKIEPILLSGDSLENCREIAQKLGITTVIANQSPADKLHFIARQTALHPTVMVGDGVNDGPALAKATVGVSLSSASQLAIQTAQVVLMSKGLSQLPLALRLGKATYTTIKENLFWAFSYNIIAVPIAAFGYLGMYAPMYGALVMGLSDVVLAFNSLRLSWKKLG